jgi:hypothetical protein
MHAALVSLTVDSEQAPAAAEALMSDIPVTSTNRIARSTAVIHARPPAARGRVRLPTPALPSGVLRQLLSRGAGRRSHP